MREDAHFLRSRQDHAAQAGYPHTLPAVHSETDAAVQALALTSTRPGVALVSDAVSAGKFNGHEVLRQYAAGEAVTLPAGMSVTMLDTEPALDSLFIANAGRQLQDACHGASAKAGWWQNVKTGTDHIAEVRGGTELGKALVGQKLMLVVSEVSEGMEGHRKGLMDDKLPHRSMIEVELADAVIRIADLAGALDLDLGGAIAEKLAFNAIRPDHKLEARGAVGGKAY